MIHCIYSVWHRRTMSFFCRTYHRIMIYSNTSVRFWFPLSVLFMHIYFCCICPSKTKLRSPYFGRDLLAPNNNKCLQWNVLIELVSCGTPLYAYIKAPSKCPHNYKYENPKLWTLTQKKKVTKWSAIMLRSLLEIYTGWPRSYELRAW